MSRLQARAPLRSVAPLLIAFAIVLLCIGLGVWQLQRLHWKEGLIAQREAVLHAPPVAPPRTLAAVQPLDLHRVVAEGTFISGKDILLHAIAPEGEAGFDVFAPLRTVGAAALGQIIFVDRGFVPTRLADAAAMRTAAEPAGTVKVGGLLRLAPNGKPGWFLPDNQPHEKQWFWVDLPAMAGADGLANVAPFYIAADATPANPGGWPRGGVSLPELPNNHLQYALTWFALALAAAIIFTLAQRRGAAGSRGGNGAPPLRRSPP